jgi:hypothetical protein
MASTSPPIDLNLKLGRSERWAIAITSHLPEPLRENPERAMINTVAILLRRGVPDHRLGEAHPPHRRFGGSCNKGG